jgi:hypothetical protein
VDKGSEIMPEAKDLTPNFRHVKLLLAREKGHPQGEHLQGYDLLVPLHDNGQLDAETWKKHQASCRVRYFTGNGNERIGRLRRKPGGQWYFDYEEGELDDEIGFRFGEERFVLGEYISVKDRRATHTYQVARVEKP